MWKYAILSVFICGYYVICVSSEDGKPKNPLTQVCLGCICEAISGCNTTRKCVGNICGPFSITWGYWADGNKPTIAQKSVDDPDAYASCANDPYCAASAVQQYMYKFYQDCNGDGKVDCDDFAAIHKLGGYGCQGPLPDFYVQRYRQCMLHVG
ncbi:hypothetical protein PPYR_13784 [Photinus pyralis]|uniref:lysozyme n=2 Tax=Photinus pyralis TaxID=7054 RepID=A0A5N4AA30_PHOPY|nr:lysozyme-like [Photinus pyralis]KAB0794164.1 hypothetical protein PPYR_13784 [Photinus pyralis]